jgi:glutamate-1-semialdehyde 2,1-aminomutase
LTRSEELFDRAREVIPGGVNSPVRAFRSVGGTPRFVARGDGAWIEDVDGNRYVDFVQSWGALLFGHARPEVLDAAIDAARRGTSFGAPTEGEVVLAEKIVAAVTSVQEVRLVSSGTEACMSALRLARGFTGRPAVLKFDGCYHGHSDALLAKAGSGVATFGLPDSPGVTAATAQDTLVVPYNDLEAVASAFERRGDEIACVIVEGVAANMGVVPAASGFAQGLREICDRHGSLLVVDEVITGFRLARGGAQEFLGLSPDLTTMGKVMGGGFPCAAFGGRADVMQKLAPVGPVYQAGTLSGNPVAVAAGIATLDLIDAEDPYPSMREYVTALTEGISGVLARKGIAHRVNRVGTLFSIFFGDSDVTDYATSRAADHETYKRFFNGMLANGVYLPPSGYEGWFMGAAHGDDEIECTLRAAEAAL